jgi:site-specific DNA-adenine methylase
MSQFRYGFPSIYYDGSKARIAEDLIELLPRNGRRCIDIFAGRGNFSWAVLTLIPTRFSSYHLNDIQTAPFFDAIITNAHKIKPPESLEESTRTYLKCKGIKKVKGYDALSANQKLLEPYLTFGGRGYCSGGPAKKINAASFQRSVLECQRLLTTHPVTITKLHWMNLLSDIKLNWKDFVYFDPPYFNGDVRAYKPWQLSEYKSFIEFLEQAPFRWMLSEYQEPMYVKAFGKPVYRKSIPCGQNPKKRIEECVWINY